VKKKCKFRSCGHYPLPIEQKDENMSFISTMAFHLAIEALTASGIKDEELIHNYLDKLDFLFRQFNTKHTCDFSLLTQAENLLKALWRKKPHRYQSQGHFRLCNVIDAQISDKTEAVGKLSRADRLF
jgi:hypothetical protein